MWIQFARLAIVAFVMLSTASASMAKCINLARTHVAFGEPAAADGARDKLRKDAVEKLKERGWTGKGVLRSRNVKVSCETNLNLGPFGKQYRCSVIATVCTPRVTTSAPKQRALKKRTSKKRTSKKRTSKKQASKRSARKKPNGAIGSVVKLRLKGSSFEISGALKEFNKKYYVIAPPNSNNVMVPVAGFDCIGDGCPKITN